MSSANTLTLDRFVPQPETLIFNDLEHSLLGAYIDAETTGLDPKRDKIIELSVVPFQFRADGSIARYGTAHSWLNNPGFKISDEITRITGIQQDELEGQSIDVDAVSSIISECEFIISHNAKFDRPFCEAAVPSFRELRWGCSYRDVPWRDHYASGNLEFLLFKHCHQFIDAHRSEVDAYAGVQLLRTPWGGILKNETPLSHVLDRARGKWWRVYSSGSPFQFKDDLKARGYAWNDGENMKPKAWWKDISDDVLSEELKWLKIEVRCDEPMLRVMRPQDRFTDRV